MPIVALKQQDARPSPRSHATAARMALQDEGFNVVGAMAYQRTDLEAESMLNEAEDMMRQELRRVLDRQARALAERDLAAAAALNSVARVLLGQVDELDAAQDEEPVTAAFGHNYEAAASGRRIIDLTDGGLPPAA
ncbi:MAG: hypothetical protein M0T85_15700 [Dehalococcoidales bacterium]|nr:hypothetical protein [Dehalococcoidales bacterium]